MSNSKEQIIFKQVFIVLNKQVQFKKEDLAVDNDFQKFKQQLSSLLNKDLQPYQISFQSSEQENQQLIKSITNEDEYRNYINNAHIQDYGTIHIFLEQPNDQQNTISSKSQQIFDSCFDGQQMNESIEIGQEEDIKGNNIVNSKNILDSYSTNEPRRHYDASVAIIETNESLVNPSLQLLNLQSLQKTSEVEALTGQYNKKQSISQVNLVTVQSYDTVQSTEDINLEKQDLDLNNKETLENMINYEIIRQILNKYPKLQPDNIDDDIKIKQHIAQFQSQNAANRRSISPQPKQGKKNDLSQSMMIPTYKCNNCKNPIENVRFHCLVCQDTDHCEQCQLQKRGEHNHPFIKYKNVQSSKLNKSQRLFPPSSNNQNTGSVMDAPQNQIIPPFQQAGKNAMSVYFTPTQTPNTKPSLASSNANFSQNQQYFQFLNMSKQSLLAQSLQAQPLPSALRNQQQQPQPIQHFLQGNNGLNQSQNINLPIDQYKREQQQLNQFNQQSNQYGQQQIQYRDSTYPLNELFPQQVNSQQFYSSSIPSQNFANMNKFHTIQNITLPQNSNGTMSSISSNSASFGSLQDIQIRNTTECNKFVKVERGQIFNFVFKVKNGGKFMFPEGGIFQGSGIYQNVKKQIQQLQPDETQDIEIQLKAPNQIQKTDYIFKVAFPANPEQTQFVEKGPRFYFELQTI